MGYNLLGLAVWWSEVDHLFSALFPYEGPAAALGVIDVSVYREPQISNIISHFLSFLSPNSHLIQE